jgi:predicted dehydrogenase
MSRPLPIGVIGAARSAQAIADHDAALPGARVSRWAPSPCGQDRARAAGLAERTGAEFSTDWEAVARDPALRALLILSSDPGRGAAVEVALSAGKVVLSPLPLVTTQEEVDRLAAAQARGRGVLLAPSALRYTPAGSTTLRMVADGEFGTLQSLYAGGRFPREDRAQGGPGVLEEAGWEVFDFLLAAAPAPIARVHAQTGALFGPGTVDTATLIIRFEDNMVATIDLSRCLPPSIPTAPRGEIEVELIGSRQAVRLEPYATSLTLFGPRAIHRPWVDDPVVAMVRDVVRAASGEADPGDGVARLRRAMALMDAAR